MLLTDSLVDCDPTETYLAVHFLDTIDALYQHALNANPSVRNRVAYAGYLAGHGRPFDALREFRQIVQSDAIAARPDMLQEVLERIARIETRLQND